MLRAGFYRNGVDRDIDKFGEIVPDLFTQFHDNLGMNNVYFYQSSYSDGIDASLQFIESNDSIILCTHGCKYGLYFDYGLQQLLVDSNNMNILRDKCIVAISCLTMYKNSIFKTPQNVSKVFLGFKDEFYWVRADGYIPPEQLSVIEIYSTILINSIVEVSTSGGTYRDLHNAIHDRAVKLRTEIKGFDAMYIDSALSPLINVDLVGDSSVEFIPGVV